MTTCNISESADNGTPERDPTRSVPPRMDRANDPLSEIIARTGNVTRCTRSATFAPRANHDEIYSAATRRIEPRYMHRSSICCSTRGICGCGVARLSTA